MKKILTVFGLGLSALPMLYSAYVASAVIDRGYDWREMDWNSDGRTAIHEVIAATDIIPHRAVLNGRRCIHYFAYAKAELVRTDCEDVASLDPRETGLVSASPSRPAP